MSNPEPEPAIDLAAAPTPLEVELPDTYVYEEDDRLTTASAPVENGTGDQTGGLGPL